MLKGICCLIVIYVHFHDSHTNALQDAIGSFAYVAVTLFFLISAYGMMLSAERNESYLKHFWRNRLVSLLIPCLCVNIAGLLLGALKGSVGWQGLYQINGYVIVLLQFCLWFYVVEYCKRKWFLNNKKIVDTLLIGGVVLSSLVLYLFFYENTSNTAGWCFERMGLVWGILLYRYYKPFVQWMNKHRLVKVAFLCLLSAILGILYLKYKVIWLWGEYLLKIVLGLSIIVFLFTASSNRKLGNAVGRWLGGVSYEVYLSHGMVMGFLAWRLPDLQSGIFILSTVIITLLLSWGVHMIDKPIVKKLRL